MNETLPTKSNGTARPARHTDRGRRRLQAASLAAVASLLPAVQALAASPAFSVGNLTLGENFNSIGTAATATTVTTMPDGWKLDSDAATPTTSYNAAATSIPRAGGLTGTGALTTSSSGGAYNLGDNAMTTSTDRAVGFLTSGSFTSPRNIFVKITNNTGQSITAVDLSYNIEKYRNGSRAFDFNLSYGTDGSLWTAAPGGNQTFAADGATATIAGVVSTPKVVSIPTLSIAPGADLYLRWAYIGNGGNTNAQALALDDFSITATTGTVAGDPNDLVWDPNGATAPNPSNGSGTWSGGNTWWSATGSTNATFAATNNAIFGTGSGTGSFDVTLDSAKTAGKVVFADASPTYTLTGESITLNGASGTAIEAKSSATIASNVVLASSGIVAVADAGETLSITGALSGATATLTKSGNGTLVLGNAANSFDHVDLSSGTIVVGAEGALGTGSLVVNSGTLKTSAAVSFTRNITMSGSLTFDSNGFNSDLSGRLLGTGGLVKNGAGTLSLTDAALVTTGTEYTGAVTINAGTLRVASGNEGARSQLGTGIVTVNSGATLTYDNVKVGQPWGFQNHRTRLMDGATFAAIGTAEYNRGDSVEQEGDALRVANGTSTAQVNVNLNAVGANTVFTLNNPIRQLTALANSTPAPDTYATIHVGGGGRVVLASGEENAATGVFAGSWAIDNGTVQLGPIRPGSLGASPGAGNLSEPLHALGFKGGVFAQANPVAIAANGMLAIGADKNNVNNVNNEANTVRDQLRDYLQAPITLNGGKIASTSFQVVTDQASILYGQLDPAQKVHARIGGALTVNSGSVLLYNPIDDASIPNASEDPNVATDDYLGARNVNLVADGPITWNGTLTVDPGTATGGALNFAKTGGTVTVSAPSTLQVNANAIVNLGGTHDSLSNGGVGHVSVANAGTFNVSAGPKNVGNVSGAGNTTVATGALLTANHLRQGNVTLDGSATIRSSGGAASGTSKVTSVTLNGPAKLDLTDNKLITADAIGTWDSGTSTYTGITGKVKSGRNTGAWDGAGIMTSLADADLGKTALGVATGAQAKGLGAGQTGTWGGQTVSDTSTLVMYTYAGDADLNGKVNGDDYFRIDANVGSNGSKFGWFNGDFNYDGKINGDDYFLIDSNVANALGTFPTAGGVSEVSALGDGVAAVPEPTSIALLGLSATALLARRRRRDAR